MLCLVENETKVLKTGRVNLVKNTQNICLCLHILLFQGFIFVSRQVLQKSMQNLENYKLLHKKNVLTLISSQRCDLFDYFSDESVTNKSRK